MRNKVFACFLFAVLSFFSCDSLEKNEEGKKVVVEFGTDKLYKEDLEKLLTQNYTKEDSINIVDAYIKNWLQKKATIKNALDRISNEEMIELNIQVQQYRDDLILNKFYNKELEKLNEDTITDNEIQAYYNQNQRSFELNEDLAKPYYIIAPTSAKEFIESNLKNTSQLQKKCTENESWECYWGNDWFNFTQLKSQLLIDDESFTIERAKSNPIYTQEKDGKFFAIYVNEVKNIGETGPLEYYQPTIKSILFNKRKVSLQKQIEDSLYNDALQNDKITFYE